MEMDVKTNTNSIFGVIICSVFHFESPTESDYHPMKISMRIDDIVIVYGLCFIWYSHHFQIVRNIIIIYSSLVFHFYETEVYDVLIAPSIYVNFFHCGCRFHWFRLRFPYALRASIIIINSAFAFCIHSAQGYSLDSEGSITKYMLNVEYVFDKFINALKLDSMEELQFLKNYMT